MPVQEALVSVPLNLMKLICFLKSLFFHKYTNASTGCLATWSSVFLWNRDKDFLDAPTPFLVGMLMAGNNGEMEPHQQMDQHEVEKARIKWRSEPEDDEMVSFRSLCGNFSSFRRTLIWWSFPCLAKGAAWAGSVNWMMAEGNETNSPRDWSL